MTSLDVPILLIAWRRPHTLRQVINAIRPFTPTRLFIACDGSSPENPSDAVKVLATRQVIDLEIDWPCQIERLYSDVNLGCSVGPIRAIDWFFGKVEEGIILEDDCVPHHDFFSYCSSLLERYRHDTRVWCISGNNFQNGQWRGDGSYYFSRYNHCWGWASWRRCWHHYDAYLSRWPALNASKALSSIFEDALEQEYWEVIWQRTYEKLQPITWWDYQWFFACISNGGLTALPNRNLVSNVGFGKDATHTTIAANPTVADKGLGELIHPQFILRDAAADQYTYDYHFRGAQRRRRRRLVSRIANRLRFSLCQVISALR